MSIVKVNYLRLLWCKESNARFYDRRKSNEFILRWIQNTLTTEVPHLEKMGSFLQLIILVDNAEVDLSSSYFNFLMIITIKAFAFASPGLDITNSSSLHQQNLKFDFVYNITSYVGEMGFPFWNQRPFLFIRHISLNSTVIPPLWI
jgi:hypothetical protein